MTDEGGYRNKDGRSKADDRNKEGDRNKTLTSGTDQVIYQVQKGRYWLKGAVQEQG